MMCHWGWKQAKNELRNGFTTNPPGQVCLPDPPTLYAGEWNWFTDTFSLSATGTQSIWDYSSWI